MDIDNATAAGKSTSDWKKEFRKLWDRAVAAWDAGRTSPKTMFNNDDAKFLESIGCTRQELFDFVDDHREYDGSPDFESSLGVAAIRREYFLKVMHGKSTGRKVPMSTLPAKSAEVDGIPWLPRLLAKARIKLRGEMPDELMYGCAGDRPFLAGMKMTLPQFLQLVWDCGDDDRRIVDTVKRCRDGRR